jgi:uncharacterized protein (DUF1330 family)
MDRPFSMGLAMIASASFGKSPEAYAIVDISEMTDPNLFKDQLLPEVTPALLATSGGHYLVRTDKVTVGDGTSPARFVVIAFDDMAKENAWATSQAKRKLTPSA